VYENIKRSSNFYIKRVVRFACKIKTYDSTHKYICTNTQKLTHNSSNMLSANTVYMQQISIPKVIYNSFLCTMHQFSFINNLTIIMKRHIITKLMSMFTFFLLSDALNVAIALTPNIIYQYWCYIIS